jgi:hypothetical protein
MGHSSHLTHIGNAYLCVCGSAWLGNVHALTLTQQKMGWRCVIIQQKNSEYGSKSIWVSSDPHLQWKTPSGFILSAAFGSFSMAFMLFYPRGFHRTAKMPAEVIPAPQIAVNAVAFGNTNIGWPSQTGIWQSFGCY